MSDYRRGNINRGRPPKALNELRDRTVRVSLNEEEIEAVERAKKRLNSSASEIFRYLILHVDLDELEKRQNANKIKSEAALLEEELKQQEQKTQSLLNAIRKLQES